MFSFPSSNTPLLLAYRNLEGMVIQYRPLLQLAFWVVRYQQQHTLSVCTDPNRVRSRGWGIRVVMITMTQS